VKKYYELPGIYFENKGQACGMEDCRVRKFEVNDESNVNRGTELKTPASQHLRYDPLIPSHAGLHYLVT